MGFPKLGGSNRPDLRITISNIEIGRFPWKPAVPPPNWSATGDLCVKISADDFGGCSSRAGRSACFHGNRPISRSDFRVGRSAPVPLSKLRLQKSNHSVPGTTSVGTRTAASRADPPRSGCAARASTGGFSGQGFRSGRRLSIVLFVSMLGWLARQMLWSPDSSFEVQAAVASSEKKCQARDINIVRAGCQAGARCACSKNEA